MIHSFKRCLSNCHIILILLLLAISYCSGCSPKSADISFDEFWKRYLPFANRTPEEPADFHVVRVRKSYRNEIFAAKCRVDSECRDAVRATTQDVDFYFTKNDDIDWERTRLKRGTLWDAKLGNDFPFLKNEIASFPWWDIQEMDGVVVRRWQASGVGHGVRYIYCLMPTNTQYVYMYGYREY